MIIDHTKPCICIGGPMDGEYISGRGDIVESAYCPEWKHFTNSWPPDHKMPVNIVRSLYKKELVQLSYTNLNVEALVWVWEHVLRDHTLPAKVMAYALAGALKVEEPK